MKILLLGGAALMFTAGVAVAADLPRAPAYKAAPAVARDWSGFYLGGYWGSSIGQSSATTPGGLALGSVDISQKSWTAGATVGLNWQASPAWLIGLEADLGFLDNKRKFTEWNDPSVSAGVKTGGYATARARLGYVTGPSLLYVTGGAAFLNIEDSFGGCANCTPVRAADALTVTKTGWTAGAGIETKLGRNWSQKTEYLYIDAGTTNVATNLLGVPQNVSFRNDFHIIKTGLNYQFGGPAEALPFFSGVMLPTSHNWAGFYLGGNAGGGLTTSPAPGNFGGGPLKADNDMRGGGGAAGIQAGYNVMNLFGRPRWFAGVEGDIGYLGIKASHQDWNDGFVMSQKTNWYGTLRGRFGTTTGPALLYSTAGAAFVKVENGIVTTATTAQLAPLNLAFSNDVRSDTRAGWTVGGGTEVALNAGWSAKLEYLYIDAGKSTRAGVLSGPGGSTTINSEVANRFQVVRAGVNYNFNEPVVARY